MESVMSRQILVLDCYRHTLSVVRSLSTAGCEVTLGVTAGDLDRGFVHVSRHVTNSWLHPDIVDGAEDFDAALLDFLTLNPRVTLIFPVGENSIRRLACIRERLPSDVHLVMPRNSAIEVCLDKPSAYQLARNCEIPVPGTRVAGSAREMRDAVKDLGFPSIVKSTDSRSLVLGRKCIFVRDELHLENLAASWPERQADVVVQNQVSGLRHNCDFVARGGEILLYCESEILSTDRIDYSGISVFDRSIPPNRKHLEYCRRLVAELNYTGLGLIQFLRDTETGISYFLEANPRSAATIALAIHCGVDLPAAAVAVFVGDFSAPDASYTLNRSQHWFHGDLLGLHWERENGDVSLMQSATWLLSAFSHFMRADCHRTFRWRDPMPTIKLYRGLLSRAFSGSR